MEFQTKTKRCLRFLLSKAKRLIRNISHWNGKKWCIAISILCEAKKMMAFTMMYTLYVAPVPGRAPCAKWMPRLPTWCWPNDNCVLFSNFNCYETHTKACKCIIWNKTKSHKYQTRFGFISLFCDLKCDLINLRREQMGYCPLKRLGTLWPNRLKRFVINKFVFVFIRCIRTNSGCRWPPWVCVCVYVHCSRFTPRSPIVWGVKSIWPLMFSNWQRACRKTFVHLLATEMCPEKNGATASHEHNTVHRDVMCGTDRDRKLVHIK